jgi:hypothetical protein
MFWLFGLFYINLVYFTSIWSILQHNNLVYFTTIWSILQQFGLFYNNLVYFTTIWSILWPFGLFSPFLVCCTKKNLAALRLSFLPPHQHWWSQLPEDNKFVDMFVICCATDVSLIRLVVGKSYCYGLPM